MAEVMALCAVFLTSNSKEGNCGLRWGVLALCCWRLLAGCVAALWHAGSAPAGYAYATAALGSDIWLLGVIGFGLLAGIFRCTAGCRRHMLTPLRQLPRVFYGSHENWPAGHVNPVTACGNAPLWWGIALLVLGMITASSVVCMR